MSDLRSLIKGVQITNGSVKENSYLHQQNTRSCGGSLIVHVLKEIPKLEYVRQNVLRRVGTTRMLFVALEYLCIYRLEMWGQ